MKLYIIPLTILSTILLFSCNNYNEKEKHAELDETTSYTGVSGDSVKLVKSGSLHVKMKDIEQGTREISGLAKKLGGMVYGQDLNYTVTERKELRLSPDSTMSITVLQPQADITVRVPSQHLEEFMYGVTDMGYFTSSRRLDIEDKSLVYFENILKQANRTGTLSKPTGVKEKTLSDLVAIDIKDQVTDQQIANRTIDADARFSIVKLVLSQNALVKKEVIANYVISDYKLPFGQRLGNAVSNGWHFFLNFILVMANLWMFIVAGVFALFAYRLWQHHLKGRQQMILRQK